MDFETAIEELSFHCGSHPDIEDPRWAAGFLQTLRPYRGQLDSASMDHVVQCVDAIADHLKTSPKLNRSAMNSLWGIMTYSRAWALHPDGMLQRNNLIAPDDLSTLSDWLDDLAERVTFMLDGGHDPKIDT